MSDKRARLWRTFTNSKLSADTRQKAYHNRKKLLKAIRERIRNLNNNRVNAIAEELEANSRGGGNKLMYEYARLMQKKENRRFSIIDKEGYEHFNPDTALDLLRQFYVNKFNQADISKLETWEGNPRPLNNKITVNEVSNAIGKLNNNRSTGPDGIPVEWYKYGSLKMLEELTEDLNKMYEKHELIPEISEGILIPMNKPNAPHTVEKTRPITLLNTIRKVLCLIVRARIIGKLERYISPNQHGYRSGRSTTEVIWALQYARAATEKYKEKYEMIATDLSAAFDKPIREKLLRILKEEVGLEQDEMRMIRSLLAEIKLKIKVGNELGEEFVTRIGVPQGDGLSPHLFLVYMEYTLREYEKRSEKKPNIFDLRLTYADDDNILIHAEESDHIGPCNAECSCHRCQREELLWKLPIIMRENNMQMNPEKTQFITITRKTRKNTIIPQLGSDVNSTRELSIRCRKAMVALNAMHKLWIKGNPISKKTKIRLYNVTVGSIICYNIHAAAFTKAESEKLNRFHRRQIRRVLGIYWPRTMGVKATYKASGTRPISVDSTVRRWRLLGHILRGNTSAPAYRSMENFYRIRIPQSNPETNISKPRPLQRGRLFVALPNIINEEFRAVPLTKRLSITKGNGGGIDTITKLEHITKLREVANDISIGHGGKWKQLVAEIEKAAIKQWNKAERKRIGRKKDRPDNTEEKEEEEGEDYDENPPTTQAVMLRGNIEPLMRGRRPRR